MGGVIPTVMVMVLGAQPAGRGAWGSLRCEGNDTASARGGGWERCEDNAPWCLSMRWMPQTLLNQKFWSKDLLLPLSLSFWTNSTHTQSTACLSTPSSISTPSSRLWALSCMCVCGGETLLIFNVFIFINNEETRGLWGARGGRPGNSHLDQKFRPKLQWIFGCRAHIWAHYRWKCLDPSLFFMEGWIFWF